jgi:hypothetical protein
MNFFGFGKKNSSESQTKIEIYYDISMLKSVKLDLKSSSATVNDLIQYWRQYHQEQNKNGLYTYYGDLGLGQVQQPLIKKQAQLVVSLKPKKQEAYMRCLMQFEVPVQIRDQGQSEGF